MPPDELPAIARPFGSLVKLTVLPTSASSSPVRSKPGVGFAGRVVFHGPVEARQGVGVCGRNDAGIHHHGNANRHFAGRNQIVKHDGNPKPAGRTLPPAAVLKHHHAGRFGFIVLGRNVHPIIALRARIDFAVFERVFGGCAVRHVRVLSANRGRVGSWFGRRAKEPSIATTSMRVNAATKHMG